MVHFVEVFLTFSLSPFAMARESSVWRRFLTNKHPPVEDMSPKQIKSKKSCENGSYKREKRPKKYRKDVYTLLRSAFVYVQHQKAVRVRVVVASFRKPSRQNLGYVPVHLDSEMFDCFVNDIPPPTRTWAL